MTCVYCGAPLEVGDRRSWVDARSGDEGGTFDYCPGTPQDDEARVARNSGHKVRA